MGVWRQAAVRLRARRMRPDKPRVLRASTAVCDGSGAALGVAMKPWVPLPSLK